MASYGSIFEFVFDSVNGAEINIVILRRDYNGEVLRRPLGRAPVLRRENNDRIYGTSLEIYAECLNDGEYASLYSSSAYEHMVEVYKDDTLVWTGFVTPELYSEPDIAPPYDVQIIATDGLGELKDIIFNDLETRSMYEHVRTMLSHASKIDKYSLISDLKCVYDDGSVSDPDIFYNMRVNLEHEVGNSCYDVLQRLLASINGCMTLYGDSWLVFRKTDFIHLAEGGEVRGMYSNGHEVTFPAAEFGSSQKTDWWPIGQMSSVIEPAKKTVSFQAPDHYRQNVLSKGWNIGGSVRYDSQEDAYILASEGAYITQHVDFPEEVGYALSLKIRAMNAGAPKYVNGRYVDQGIGVQVKVIDEDDRPMYLNPLDTDRGIGSYNWIGNESTRIESNLAVPAYSDTKADAQDVEIVIPLYRTSSTAALAKSIDVTVLNYDGTYPINVYDVRLSVHNHTSGYEANVIINNNARESGDTVEGTLSDASRIPANGHVFMSGIPLQAYHDVSIKAWKIGNGKTRDYVTILAEDCASEVAMPRMSYKGVLNVPREHLPVLFYRSGTFYFPETYSYNLYDDELEVDMTSIPAAAVEIESMEITQALGLSAGASSGSSSSSNAGIGIGAIADLKLGSLRDVDVTDSKDGSVIQKKGDKWKSRTVQEVVDEYLKEAKKLGEWFELDDKGNIRTHKNFYSTGRVASGGAAKEGQGNSGATSGEYKMYTHVQGDPRAEWVINHGLNKVPNVKIIEDSTGEQVYGDVKVENMNVVTVSFGGAFSGRAYLD